MVLNIAFPILGGNNQMIFEANAHFFCTKTFFLIFPQFRLDAISWQRGRTLAWPLERFLHLIFDGLMVLFMKMIITRTVLFIKIMITKLIMYILIRLYTHTFDKIQILKIIVWHCHQSSAERIGEQQYDKMIIEAIWQEYKNTNKYWLLH